MFRSLNAMSTDKYAVKTEKIQTLAIKSFNKEKEITEKKEVKPVAKKVEPEKKAIPAPAKKKEMPKEKLVKEAIENINITFKKALTSREQLVFDHFYENKNTIVYARDLAKILELPRDYVYKYIKNLRSKLNEDVLQNADNGGYLLKV